MKALAPRSAKPADSSPLSVITQTGLPAFFAARRIVSTASRTSGASRVGAPKATVNFTRIMLKRLTHTGSTLRARAIEDKAAIARALEAKVLPLLRDGKVKPLMDSVYPLARASEAHARMESSHHIGKIVLAT